VHIRQNRASHRKRLDLIPGTNSMRAGIVPKASASMISAAIITGPHENLRRKIQVMSKCVRRNELKGASFLPGINVQAVDFQLAPKKPAQSPGCQLTSIFQTGKIAPIQPRHVRGRSVGPDRSALLLRPATQLTSSLKLGVCAAPSPKPIRSEK